jgi:hypothetical protein
VNITAESVIPLASWETLSSYYSDMGREYQQRSVGVKQGERTGNWETPLIVAPKCEGWAVTILLHLQNASEKYVSRNVWDS